jgi:hypothetical protein
MGAATGAVVTLLRLVWEITDFPYMDGGKTAIKTRDFLHFPLDNGLFLW